MVDENLEKSKKRSYAKISEKPGVKAVLRRTWMAELEEYGLLPGCLIEEEVKRS